MLKYLFTISFFISLLACRSTKKDSGFSVISGTIESNTSKKLYFFSFADSAALFLDQMSALDSCDIDRNGNYRLDVKIKRPCVFSLVYGAKNLVSNLFLLPEENLTINLKRGDLVPEITSRGRASDYNSFLLNLQKAFYLDSAAKHNYYIVSNYYDLQQFAKYNEERKRQEMAFFQRTFKNDSSDSSWNNYAVNSIVYSAAVDRLVYLWKKRMKGEHIIPDSSFLNFETPEFIENKTALACPAYIHFLNLYIKDLYERKVEHGDYVTKRNPEQEKAKLADKYLSSPFREIVLYNIAVENLKSVSAERNTRIFLPMDSIVNSFKSSFKN